MSRLRRTPAVVAAFPAPVAAAAPVTVLAVLAALAAAAAAPASAAADLVHPDGSFVTLLPGGDALVADDIDLPPGTGGRIAVPLPETLQFETARATLRGAGRALPIEFVPPIGGLGGWLQACVGKTVRLLPAGGGSRSGELPREGRLIAAGDPALVEIADGITAVAAERLVCATDADGRFRLAVDLPDRTKADVLDLSYRLGGWSWQARHRLDLDAAGGTGRLSAAAVIQVPPGADLTRARLRLAEGDVPRAGGPRPAPAYDMAEKRVMAAAPMQAEEVAESSTYDLVLFDIPGTWDLRGPAQRSLPLRPSAAVQVEDVAVLRFFNTPHAPSLEDPVVPRRHLRFEAGKDVVLPSGVIEVGVRRADGTWAPLGEVATPRVPAGRKADVALGTLPDVVIFYRRPSLDVLPQGRFQREAVIEWEALNRRDGPTRLELRHELGGPYELLEASPAPAKKDGSAIAWDVPLAKGQKVTLRAKLRFDPRPVRN